jgi:hypothetical protein
LISVIIKAYISTIFSSATRNPCFRVKLISCQVRVSRFLNFCHPCATRFNPWSSVNQISHRLIFIRKILKMFDQLYNIRCTFVFTRPRFYKWTRQAYRSSVNLVLISIRESFSFFKLSTYLSAYSICPTLTFWVYSAFLSVLAKLLFLMISAWVDLWRCWY